MPFHETGHDAITVHVRFAVLACTLAASPAWAGDTPRPIVAFRVEGDTKLTEETLWLLMRVERGTPVTAAQISELEKNVFSSELFKSVKIRFEDAADGVIVIATLVDKHSWIVMPTAYLLSSNWAVGAGFAENNLFGENKKLLLYAQLGELNNYFVGAYVIPSFRGSRLSLQFDTFLQSRQENEFAIPSDDPASTELARQSNHLFLNAGVAAGWIHRWWLRSQFRVRAAYVRYDDSIDPNTGAALPNPSPDGWDVTWQASLKADARTFDRGISAGPYAELASEVWIPGLSSYTYAGLRARAFYAHRLFARHELQVRLYGNLGWRLPFHDEWTLGAASDLRGYANEQFRGDVRALARAEYSVEVGRYRWFTFRALGFVDSGWIGFRFEDTTQRHFLPGQSNASFFRNDVGGGFRVYVNNIVLPLVGIDVGYGLESRTPNVYLQLGLTDL